MAKLMKADQEVRDLQKKLSQLISTKQNRSEQFKDKMNKLKISENKVKNDIDALQKKIDNHESWIAEASSKF